MDLKKFIRAIPDFPKPGIIFRDVTPLLKDPAAFVYTIERLAEAVTLARVDLIVGIEARGFIFGAPLATSLGLPFIPVRKPGKLPSKTLQVAYDLEYGSSQLDIHEDAITKGQRVVIIDDLLATGGTVQATAKLVELLGGTVALMAFVIELSMLKAREKLQNYEVISILQY